MLVSCEIPRLATLQQAVFDLLRFFHIKALPVPSPKQHHTKLFRNMQMRCVGSPHEFVKCCGCLAIGKSIACSCTDCPVAGKIALLKLPMHCRCFKELLGPVTKSCGIMGSGSVGKQIDGRGLLERVPLSRAPTASPATSGAGACATPQGTSC